jgi:hypothetical protein
MFARSKPLPMPPRLGSILFDAPPKARALLDGRSFKPHRKLISDQTRVHWASVGGLASDALYAAVDIEVAGILLGGWEMAETLQAERERSQSGAPTLVPMVRHTIATVHQPAVEILVGEVVVHKISLDLQVELVLDAVVLVIRDGRIAAIQTGYCSVSCGLKLGGLILLPIASKKFALPGAIDLTPKPPANRDKTAET